MKTLPTIAIYIYDLKITVSDDSVRPHKPKEGEPMNKVLASQMARVFLHSETASLLGEDFAFDGVSTGWSPVKLVEEGEVKRTKLEMGKRRDGAPNSIDLGIRLVGRMNIGELVVALQQGRPSNHPCFAPFMKWLNALHRKDPQSQFITRPRQNVYFERSERTAAALQSTGGVLEALRGFFATVMVRFGQLTVNIDSSTTPFWVPKKCLLEIASAFAGVQNVSALNNSHWGIVSARITQVLDYIPQKLL